jgi:hypothetical protein
MYTSTCLLIHLAYPEQQPPPVAEKRHKNAPQYSNKIVDPTSVLADAVGVSGGGVGGWCNIYSNKQWEGVAPKSDFASSVLVSPSNTVATTMNTGNARKATGTFTAGVLGTCNSTTTSFICLAE